MSKTNSSRPGNAAPAVVYSGDVTTVAQLAQSAPIAPPQNLEAEESVLGAMLLSPGAIGAVSEVLDASDFYRESHAKIYRAGLALYAKGEPVDAITIVDELEERGELEGAGAYGCTSSLHSSRRRRTPRTMRASSARWRPCVG